MRNVFILLLLTLCLAKITLSAVDLRGSCSEDVECTEGNGGPNAVCKIKKNLL